MSTPINPGTGTVKNPTVPGNDKESKTPVNPKTGFVTKPTSNPRPVRPSLPKPGSNP